METTKELIPPIIHQVWINTGRGGGAEPTKAEETCFNTVERLHPNWQVTDWLLTDGGDSYGLYTVFGSPALQKLGLNFACFLNRIIEDYRGPKDRRAIASDFIRMLVLYVYGGFYLDYDMYCLQPLDDLRGEDIVFGQIRESLIAEAIIGVRAEDPRIAEILTRYVETQTPESGTCCLNLSGYTDAKGIKTFAPDYFVPHMRKESGEAQYRHTDNTYTVHCWRQNEYDFERLEKIGAELRERTGRKPIESIQSIDKECDCQRG